MVRSYKVFFSEKVILLSTDEYAFLKDASTLVISHPSARSLKQSVSRFLSDSAFSKLFILAKDLQKLWLDFRSLFQMIEAAGGLVRNGKGEALFVFRNGKWDLPKGKIEKGEKLPAAAVREVEEECGISDVRIIKEMTSTYHIYYLEGAGILKKTTWFEMRVDRSPRLKAQQEEGISEVIWASEKDIPELIKNTYASIKEVLAAD